MHGFVPCQDILNLQQFTTTNGTGGVERCFYLIKVFDIWVLRKNSLTSAIDSVGVIEM